MTIIGEPFTDGMIVGAILAIGGIFFGMLVGTVVYWVASK